MLKHKQEQATTNNKTFENNMKVRHRILKTAFHKMKHSRGNKRFQIKNNEYPQRSKKISYY